MYNIHKLLNNMLTASTSTTVPILYILTVH